MVDWVYENAPNFKTPLLIIHGKADRLSPYKASEKFFNNVKFEDKTLKLYPDSYHQPFIDLNRDEVFSDIEQWLEARI
jgi:alpha-beta hydrolase superfamily lysophospholipase